MIILLMSRLECSRDLLEASVTPETWRRYKRCVQDFISWLDERGINPVRLTDLDWAMKDYFQYWYDRDPSAGRRQKCVQTRLGVIKVWPHARDKLLASSLALRGWTRQVPVRKRNPCPKSVCLVLIWHFVKSGRRDMALVLWLMFDAYLRVGEVLSIRLSDVLLPSEHTPGGIRLPRTKTGSDQSVIIRNGFLWQLMIIELQNIPTASTTLFTLSYSHVRQLLGCALEDLGLEQLCLSPHSFRHGGASEDHLSGTPLADIIQRGRWKRQQTAEYYIQSGRALLLGTQVPRNVRECGERLSTNPHLILLGL